MEYFRFGVLSSHCCQSKKAWFIRRAQRVLGRRRQRVPGRCQWAASVENTLNIEQQKLRGEEIIAEYIAEIAENIIKVLCSTYCTTMQGFKRAGSSTKSIMIRSAADLLSVPLKNEIVERIMTRLAKERVVF